MAKSKQKIKPVSDFEKKLIAFNAYLYKQMLGFIIDEFKDEPKKVGKFVAISEFNRRFTSKSLGSHEAFIIEAIILNEVVCYRFLHDWRCDSRKTDEEFEELNKKFCDIMLTKEVHKLRTAFKKEYRAVYNRLMKDLGPVFKPE